MLDAWTNLSSDHYLFFAFCLGIVVMAWLRPN